MGRHAALFFYQDVARPGGVTAPCGGETSQQDRFVRPGLVRSRSRLIGLVWDSLDRQLAVTRLKAQFNEVANELHAIYRKQMTESVAGRTTESSDHDHPSRTAC